jgi:hypothetical protein
MKQSIKLIVLCACFTLGPGTHARAGDCVVDCMNRSGCWSGGSVSNPQMCNDQLHRCNIQCEGQNQKTFGAIAYSAADKGYGWSHGWNDLSKAKKVALDNCSEHGSACKLWVWYENSCGALAADGKIVTWGTASAKQSANQRALAECARAGGKKCAIQVSQCSQ